MVCKEASHQIILGVTNETHGIATGLITEETDGMGLSTKGFRRFDGQKKPATRDDKSHLKCEKYGMNRHTKDQCFKIIGYPDWWTDGHKTSSNKGAEKDKPSTSPTANTRSAYMAQTHFKNPNGPWIFDCGATDTMSYELSDFTDISKPIKTHIQVANRERMNEIRYLLTNSDDCDDTMCCACWKVVSEMKISWWFG
nr:hypothetical protein [Tanacetum cinerariifolium]